MVRLDSRGLRTPQVVKKWAKMAILHYDYRKSDRLSLCYRLTSVY